MLAAVLPEVFFYHKQHQKINWKSFLHKLPRNPSLLASGWRFTVTTLFVVVVMLLLEKPFLVDAVYFTTISQLVNEVKSIFCHFQCAHDAIQRKTNWQHPKHELDKWVAWFSFQHFIPYSTSFFVLRLVFFNFMFFTNIFISLFIYLIEILEYVLAI